MSWANARREVRCGDLWKSVTISAGWQPSALHVGFPIGLTDVPEGEERVHTNDVTVDDRGLIYTIDRRRGLNIVERS